MRRAFPEYRNSACRQERKDCLFRRSVYALTYWASEQLLVFTLGLLYRQEMVHAGN